MMKKSLHCVLNTLEGLQRCEAINVEFERTFDGIGAGYGRERSSVILFN